MSMRRAVAIQLRELVLDRQDGTLALPWTEWLVEADAIIATVVAGTQAAREAEE